MKTKQCYKCHKKFPATLKFFNEQPKSEDGLGKFCSKCARAQLFALLKWYYGITREDWNKLYKKQHGCCAICHRPQTELSHRLGVDHDHKTGKIRGLLCSICNAHYGWFEKFKYDIIKYEPKPKPKHRHKI